MSRARQMVAMRRQFGSLDTLVPPNFSTTQDGSIVMMASPEPAGSRNEGAQGARKTMS